MMFPVTGEEGPSHDNQITDLKVQSVHMIALFHPHQCTSPVGKGVSEMECLL